MTRSSSQNKYYPTTESQYIYTNTQPQTDYNTWTTKNYTTTTTTVPKRLVSESKSYTTTGNVGNEYTKTYEYTTRKYWFKWIY